MAEGLLLRNALCVVWHPAEVERADLRVRGDEIVERGVGLAAQGEEVLDLEGRVVIPGMVCAHHHLYSALARGMPAPSSSPRNFRELLEKIWWRLDRALDAETVEVSALAGTAEAALCGTTMIFDHHSSPTAIDGSLDCVRRGIDAVGLRGVLCYEVTDRGGPDEAQRGLAEHRRAAGTLSDNRFRLRIGAHASFTLEDATLSKCAALARELDTGIHIHVAEDPVDEAESRARYGASPIARLRAAGLLGPRTLLAHGVHLSPAEIVEAAQAGCWFLHCPRSNMNNGVGNAPVSAFPARAALGTDGIGSDMFAEARFAFFKAQEAKAGVGAERVLEMLQAGQTLASECFGRPFGTLRPGSVADLAILDYDPPTPLRAGNLAGHLLFGMGTDHVASVYAGGRWVVRDRVLQSVGLRAVMEKARMQADKLWGKLGTR